MPRNGSGVYSLPAGNPVVTGTQISSTTHNNTNTDMANALTQSLSADGQTTMTGPQLLFTGSTVPTPASGDNTLKVANTAFVAAVSDLTSLKSINGGQVAGNRNRIINGDMRIDQRNNGTAVTPSTASGYLLDRYQYVFVSASKITAQQVADAPAGFKYSTKLSVASQYAAGNAEEFCYRQAIEGQNLIDFQFGLATAQQFTFSTWVKASVAGNYSVFMCNASGARCYVTTIPATTSWVRQSITLTADTIGAWDTGNLVGLYIGFDLGSGANWNGTTGSWQTATIRRVTGSVAFVNNAAATFNTTGWQLELGSVATVFEQRPIGMELALCQRYFEIAYMHFFGGQVAGGAVSAIGTNKVAKRATPTVGPATLIGANTNFSPINTIIDGNGNAITYGTAVAAGSCEFTYSAPLSAEL
jgi:hypothetical protein